MSINKLLLVKRWKKTELKQKKGFIHVIKSFCVVNFDWRSVRTLRGRRQFRGFALWRKGEKTPKSGGMGGWVYHSRGTGTFWALQTMSTLLLIFPSSLSGCWVSTGHADPEKSTAEGTQSEWPLTQPRKLSYIDMLQPSLVEKSLPFLQLCTESLPWLMAFLKQQNSHFVVELLKSRNSIGVNCKPMDWAFHAFNLQNFFLWISSIQCLDQSIKKKKRSSFHMFPKEWY